MDLKISKNVGWVFTLGAVLVTGCSKPTTEQVSELVKKNPSILADAIKKDPQAFKDALSTAQNMVHAERQKQRREIAALERDKFFTEPLVPELGSRQAYRGDPKAPITIIEYTDFECPYCSRGADNIKKVLEMYKGKVRLTLKHLPLSFHPNARPAARYFEAIRLQSEDKAWAFHDELFKTQSDLRKLSEKHLKNLARKVRANLKALDAALKSKEIDAKIDADTAEAQKFTFTGTPSFLVGGVPLKGAVPPEEFAQVIDRLLEKK